MVTKMNIKYRSTRGGEECVTASQAVLRGLAEDGGLFVPEAVPKLSADFPALAKMTYQETAYEVMRLFLTDYTEEELKDCISRAYGRKFDTEEIAPLRQADGAWYLELFHGATIAFKDMALSILPHLMRTAAKKNGFTDEIVILTATSGDTGKAALAAFAGTPGTRIIVFYPKDGVSAVQERQMVTQAGENTAVIGIRGNFDDAQAGVKQMLSDKGLAARMREKGLRFSSANSINIGRLVPQVVYYVYAYAKLLAAGAVKEGERINVAVPTGNFGNILAACYAKQMGTPIGKLLCASNENKVLYDFFQTGVYDRNRAFQTTSSPSMDILVSSNLERLIYQIAGGDAEKNRGLMEALRDTGRYEITPKMREALADFCAAYATEAETADKIRSLYEKTGYLIDTHTAVAARAYEKYKEETKDAAVPLIVSTASPFKFAGSVLAALRKDCKGTAEFALFERLSRLAGVPVPAAVKELQTAPVLHDTVCEKSEMQAATERILGLSQAFPLNPPKCRKKA